MASNGRRNTDFGDLRESAPSDAAFLAAAGPRMGRPQSVARRKFGAFLVWVIIFAFALLTVLSAIQVNNNRMQNVELRSMLETQYNPSFKTRYSDLGKNIIDAWYNTNPSPAPVLLANGVTWPHTSSSANTDYVSNALTTEYKPSITVRNVTFIGGRQQASSSNEGLFYEIDVYSAYVNGTLMTISVTLGIPDLEDYNTLPTLMGEPTIFPTKFALGANLDSDQPNWRNVSATGNFLQQLSSWAKAYTENDSNALKQITGDNGSSFYIGALSSTPWEYVDKSVRVVWMKENNGNTSEAVAQVTWQMKLPDTVIKNPEDPEDNVVLAGAVQTQRMEILVKDPASGLPRIVAWGPVGSYLTLNENTNRFDENQYKAITNSIKSSGSSNNNGGVVPTPTPTPTPSEPAPNETDDPDQESTDGSVDGDDEHPVNAPSPNETDSPDSEN